MRQVKYLMLQGFSPVMFSDALTHKEIARSLNGYGGEVTGAGFYDMPSGLVYGESTSLGMKPGAHDQAIIRKFLGRGDGE